MANRRTLPAWLKAEYEKCLPLLKPSSPNGGLARHKSQELEPTRQAATDESSALRKANYELRTRVALLELQELALQDQIKSLQAENNFLLLEQANRIEGGIHQGKVVMHRRFADLLECPEFAYELKYGNLINICVANDLKSQGARCLGPNMKKSVACWAGVVILGSGSPEGFLGILHLCFQAHVVARHYISRPFRSHGAWGSSTLSWSSFMGPKWTQTRQQPTF